MINVIQNQLFKKENTTLIGKTLIKNLLFKQVIQKLCYFFNLVNELTNTY